MAEQQPCVRDVMVPLAQCVAASQTLVAARQRMQGQQGVMSLIVVDAENHPVGMLRYNDISHQGVAGATVADVMLTDVPMVRADQALQDLSGLMTQYDVDRVAVIDEGGTVVGELPRAALTLAETPASSAMTQETLPDAIAERQTPSLQINQGMTVIGSGGHKLGSVKEVLSDALSGGLTHIILHTGLIFGKDKSIPADLIASVNGDEVHLQVDRDEVKALPDIQVKG